MSASQAPAPAKPPLRLFTFAAPSRFYALSGALIPWLWVATVLLTLAGLYVGFIVAPTDATQGDSYRIIYIHVPAAWMSMLLYLVMAFWAAVGWAFNARLASMVARSIAPTGAMFTFLALWTGALWGRPTWGTYWVWDARLTSVLVMFVMYLGVITLWRTVDDPATAGRASAILTLVGAVNLPIIKFSVDWWNTLHQPASVFRVGGPAIHPSILVPLLSMAIAFTLLFLTLHVAAMRNEVLRRRVRSLRMLQAQRAQMA